MMMDWWNHLSSDLNILSPYNCHRIGGFPESISTSFLLSNRSWMVHHLMILLMLRMIMMSMSVCHQTFCVKRKLRVILRRVQLWYCGSLGVMGHAKVSYGMPWHCKAQGSIKNKQAMLVWNYDPPSDSQGWNVELLGKYRICYLFFHYFIVVCYVV